MNFKGIYLFFCGICMGTADLVPGISGGTIAFMMGFYQPLLESLKTINLQTLKLFFTFQWDKFFREIAWKFLLTLVAGITFAIGFFSGILHEILSNETYRVYLYSVFLGLVLASFIFCIRQVKNWSYLTLISWFGGVITAYFLTNFTLTNEIEGQYSIQIDLGYFPVQMVNYDQKQKIFENLSISDLNVLMAKKILDPMSAVFDREGKSLGIAKNFIERESMKFLNPWLVMCGAIAVCALLLPGISGSYLLTLLGVYPLIIASLADFVSGLKVLQLDYSAILVLLNVLIGIIVGAFCFARIASWLLRYYLDMSIAILSGFMIGALRSVWPFWNYDYALDPVRIHKGPQILLNSIYFPSINSPLLLEAVVCVVVGFAVVFFFEYFSQKVVNKRLDSTPTS